MCKYPRSPPPLTTYPPFSLQPLPPPPPPPPHDTQSPTPRLHIIILTAECTDFVVDSNEQVSSAVGPRLEAINFTAHYCLCWHITVSVGILLFLKPERWGYSQIFLVLKRSTSGLFSAIVIFMARKTPQPKCPKSETLLHMYVRRYTQE